MACNYRSRHYDADGGVDLIILILIAGIVYAHRAVMIKIEHYAIIAAICTSILVGLVLAFRLIKRIKSYFHHDYQDAMTIDSMDGLSFEKYVANLLRIKGYKNVKLTETYDLGIDIIAEKDGIRWGIQVKRYSSLVKASAVRQVVTALRSYNCNRAMVITNNQFSQVAKELARSNDCVLIDRNILMKWSTY